jgi:hypothetical protein
LPTSEQACKQLDDINLELEKLSQEIDEVKNRSDYLGPQGFKEHQLLDT